MLNGQATPKSEPPLPDAAAILDRYVEATGGAAAYRKFSFEKVAMIMGPANGYHVDVTSLRSRDGRRETVIESKQTTRSGVTNGIAWEILPSTGARVLMGDAAKDALARSHGFDIDDWRDEYAKAETIGEAVVHGKACYRVRLVRLNGSAVEQYFDKQTNLLVREEEQSNGVNVTLDIDSWATSQGIKYTKAFHMSRDGTETPMSVDEVEFLPNVPTDALLLPKEVEQAMNRPASALPNAADLMDRFVDATGGVKANASVKTQSFKATMTFTGQGMKAELVTKIGEAGKSYSSMDLPGAGKFEYGSNGKLSWQRNVMQDPELTTHNQIGGMFGPSGEDLQKWKQSYDKIETVSKEEVNGSPCYLVKMTSKRGGEGSAACFDTKSGLLVRLTEMSQTQGNKLQVSMLLSDYRPEGPLKMPHRIEAALAGQPVVLEITEVTINPKFADAIFDLPADVQALVDQGKRDAEDPKNAPNYSRKKPTNP